MKTRVIELSVNNRKEVIELPINPPSVEFTEKQLNQAITLLNIGEANLKGERGLKYTKLSSFFPSEKSPFYKNAKKKPDKYVAMLQEWKTTKAVVRVIISDMKINLAMLIDDFTYSMREGDGDIYYTISFSEYRTLNVPSVQITTKVRNNGLLSRPAPAAAGGAGASAPGEQPAQHPFHRHLRAGDEWLPDEPQRPGEGPVVSAAEPGGGVCRRAARPGADPAGIHRRRQPDSEIP